MPPATAPVPSGPPLDRRRFLVLGGLSATLAAAMAACGAADEEIPVSGSVARPDPLTPPPVTNAVYLRTSSSIVHNAIDSYGTLLDLDVLSADDDTLVRYVRDQHRQHATLLEEATVAAGGQAYAEPNSAIATTIVEPAVQAIDGGGNEPQDVLRYVNAFETLIGATLQGFSPLVTVPDPRELMMSIVSVDNRHAAVVASHIEGFTIVDAQSLAAAELASGQAPEVTDTAVVDTAATTTVGTGGPAPAAPLPVAQVPGAFASLAAVEVVLGGQDLTWETPGPNSYIYE